MEATFDEIFAEQPPIDTGGRSDDEMIAEFIKYDRQVKSAASERQWYASALAMKATQERGESKTVHLENSQRSQKIKVEFSSEWKVMDNEQITVVRELLGEERFAEMFKIQYVPRVRELKLFLSTGSTDERVKTAKDIVKQVVKDVPKLTPTLSVEKS